MVSKTKLTGRWKLRSPRRRTTSKTSNSGNAAQEHQEATRGALTSQESPGGTPAPSPPGQPQSQLPPPPRGDSTPPERGRPKEHDRQHHRSISDEFRLSDEPSLSASGRSRVGGSRSRSPLLGLRILTKSFSRKGRPRGEKAEGEAGGGDPLERVGGRESTKKTRLGPRGESVQATCGPKTLPRRELSGSIHKQKAQNNTLVATAVEEGNTLSRGKLIPAAGSGIRSDDQLKSGKGAKLSGTRKGQRPSQRPPQIAFIGVFLNGVAVALASYTPTGGVDARALVKSLLLEPNTPVLPGARYTASGSELAVHMAVDHKNRVYACLVADDVPLSLAFSLLEEVQIDYLSNVSTLAFSTLEHSHNNLCRAQMAQTVAKYEKVETALGQEREARRQLGEGLLDIETSLSDEEHKTDKGPEVVRLKLDAARHAAALTAARETLLRSSTKHAACGCSPPVGRSRSCKIFGAFVAGVAMLLLALLAAKCVNLAV